MYDVKKSIDVELNVQLVYTALIHEYAYEGPCRFGPPEALTQEFDLMNQAEIFKMWTQGYAEHSAIFRAFIYLILYISKCQMNFSSQRKKNRNW